jgi:transcriptional regulator with XRE-family HTH domain
MPEKKLKQLEIIKDLRFNKHWTLQKIANELGITRQRVHQLLGNTGKRPNILQEDLLKLTDYTNKEISEMYGVSEITIAKATNRFNIRNKIDSEFGHGKNYKAESLTVAKLEELNFDNIKRFPFKSPYNLLIDNSIKVRVVGSFTPKSSPSLRNVTPNWRFSLNNSRKLVDVYILVIYPLEKFFIIPDKDIPSHRTSLVFCYPTEYKNSGKWQSYEDRFDFLKNFD